MIITEYLLLILKFQNCFLFEIYMSAYICAPPHVNSFVKNALWNEYLKLSRVAVINFQMQRELCRELSGSDVDELTSHGTRLRMRRYWTPMKSSRVSFIAHCSSLQEVLRALHVDSSMPLSKSLHSRCIALEVAAIRSRELLSCSI